MRDVNVRKQAGTILNDGINKYCLCFLCGVLWPQFGNLIVTLYYTDVRHGESPRKYVKKLQSFVNQCLRRIVKVRWPCTITNDKLWKQTNEK
jgi:hypothetical protein